MLRLKKNKVLFLISCTFCFVQACIPITHIINDLKGKENLDTKIEQPVGTIKIIYKVEDASFAPDESLLLKGNVNRVLAYGAGVSLVAQGKELEVEINTKMRSLYERNKINIHQYAKKGNNLILTIFKVAETEKWKAMELHYLEM